MKLIGLKLRTYNASAFFGKNVESTLFSVLNQMNCCCEATERAQ
jgi:hypothetical protein